MRIVSGIIILMFLAFTKGIMCCQVRNVALGIVSRRINWQMLTTMETVDGKHSVSSPTCIRPNFLIEHLYCVGKLVSWFVDLEMINVHFNQHITVILH